MAVTTVFFGLVCGHLIDRFGAVRLLPFLLVPMFFASTAAAAVTPIWGIYLFMFLFGISYGLTSTMFGALWPEIYGVKHLGAVRSVTVSAMVLATAIGPGLTGALIDRGFNLPQQLWWMAAYCVIASGALLVASHAIQKRQKTVPLSGDDKHATDQIEVVG